MTLKFAHISMTSRFCYMNLWTRRYLTFPFLLFCMSPASFTHLNKTAWRKKAKDESVQKERKQWLGWFKSNPLPLLTYRYCPSRLSFGIFIGNRWMENIFQSNITEFLTCSLMKACIHHFTGGLFFTIPTAQKQPCSSVIFLPAVPCQSVSAQWERQGPGDNICQRNT